MDQKLIIFIIFIIGVFCFSQMNNNKLYSSYNLKSSSLKDTNSMNMGFVKPEHRLLKILNTVSSGSKVKLEGVCSKYIYNKNTIDKSVEDRLTAIMKKLINTLNQISKNDYYLKQIENVYGLISCKGDQRYFIDFFMYDVKNYYTIRLISDIVILRGEIYINYLNIQTGSNPTILNKYDVKFNDTGILFDGNMFKENIDQLFDSFYKQSFQVIGIQKTPQEYADVDLTSVVSMNSLTNMYFPSSISPESIKELERKDLSGYIEMYLPQNQKNIQSPMFCNKYKVEWDSYGIPNENDISDKNCLVNQNATSTTYNEPINPPGLFNNNRTDVTHHDWLLQNYPIGNSL